MATRGWLPNFDAIALPCLAKTLGWLSDDVPNYMAPSADRIADAL